MNENMKAKIKQYTDEALNFSKRANSTAIQTQSPSSTINTENQISQNSQSYEDFLRTHTSRGNLRVQVSSAGQIFPVENASVEVRLLLNDGPKVLYNTVTDNSGIAGNIELPALPSAFSQSESTANMSGTQYSVTIFHPAFQERIVDTVTIFEKIETILPIILQPNIRNEEN